MTEEDKIFDPEVSNESNGEDLDEACIVVVMWNPPQL
jgi:hypothetical protein